MEREGKVVVINDIVALLGSENDRDHMLAQEFGALRVAFLTPALSFHLHLPHADGDLCRTKFRDWDRMEKRLTSGIVISLFSCIDFRQFQSPSAPPVADSSAPSAAPSPN